MYTSHIICIILGVVKRNPLFLHEIEWKNNGFLFTTPNIYTSRIKILFVWHAFSETLEVIGSALCTETHLRI